VGASDTVAAVEEGRLRHVEIVSENERGQELTG
jgi:hypothetical protein